MTRRCFRDRSPFRAARAWPAHTCSRSTPFCLHSLATCTHRRRLRLQTCSNTQAPTAAHRRIWQFGVRPWPPRGRLPTCPRQQMRMQALARPPDRTIRVPALSRVTVSPAASIQKLGRSSAATCSVPKADASHRDHSRRTAAVLPTWQLCAPVSQVPAAGLLIPALAAPIWHSRQWWPSDRDASMHRPGRRNGGRSSV